MGNYELSRLSFFESQVIIDEFTKLGNFEFCPDNKNIVFKNTYYLKLYNIESKMVTTLFTEKNDLYYIYLDSI